MNLAATVVFLATIITNPESCDFSIDAALPPDLPGESVIVADEGPMHRRFVATLTTGEFLDLSYWACIHFGVRATMLFPDRPDGGSRLDPFDVTDHVEPRLRKLAAIILDAEDQVKLQSVLAKSRYTGGLVRKRIPHDRYAEFYYGIEKTEKFFVITIVYWFN